MKKVNRREFGKAAVALAAASPVLPMLRSATVLQAPVGQNGAPEALKPPGMNLPLTEEQRQRVQQTLERDARRRALIRPAQLAYDLEPAFVFTVRRRERSPRPLK